jgi:hypothetical protein
MPVWVALSRLLQELGRLASTGKASNSTIFPIFRDVINFARCLGLRYIWVNTLRIIQHEETDWRWELTNMEQHYCV